MPSELVTRHRGTQPLPGGRRPLNTSITAAQERTLRAIADAREVPIARIVREALDDYFASFFARDSRINRHHSGENPPIPDAIVLTGDEPNGEGEAA